MSDKEFKTIDEQLNILKSRGLTIDDEEKATDFLMHNNYYRVSGYSLTLRNHDVFSKTATFQNIIDIYSFDHELRYVLLKYLEIIEVQLKSVYAYEFTKVNGSIGYLDGNNFTKSDVHQRILDKAEEQKSKRLPHEAYLKHFVEDLKQPLPLWAYVDLLTIADISFLYSISETNVRVSVAAQFNIPNKIIGKFMHSMTILRNLCAHGSRLYNRLFEQKAKLNKKERSLLRVLKNGKLDDAHLYSFIFVIKRLLSETDFNEMKSEIASLTAKYPFVNMKYYGFRNDWLDVL